MGIKYHVHVEKRIVFVAWKGVISAEIWYEHIQRLIADTHWPSVSAMLINLHSVTDVSSIGEAEFQHAVALFNIIPEALSNKRIAVVASDAFWKSHRFGQLIAPYGPSFLVFNDMSTACIYLGIKLIDATKAIQELRDDT